MTARSTTGERPPFAARPSDNVASPGRPYQCPSLPGTSNDNPFGVQAKLLANFGRLAEWKVRGDAFPVLFEVNLTNYCNQACRWCISANSHSRNNPGCDAEAIPLDSLVRFLRESKTMGLRAVTWSGGGEPTTHPDFLDAVEAATQMGLKQGLMTNGQFPNEHCGPLAEHMSWIRVSLDTLDETTYRVQRRSSKLPSVLANLKTLANGRAEVGANLNVAEWNVGEIPAMARWCRDHGLDYFQVRPILHVPFAVQGNEPYRTQPALDWESVLEPTLLAAQQLGTNDFRVVVSHDKFRDVRDAEGNYGRSYRKCLSHYFVAVLNANGDVCVCMYHLNDEKFSFGNIEEESLAEIWAGPKREAVLAHCATTLDLSQCQVCCKGHEINRFLHKLENPDPGQDLDFL